MTKKAPVEPKVQEHRRKVLQVPIIILKLKKAGLQKAFFGYAKNISRGGMFIASANPQEPGSQFRVEFELPAPLARKIQCTCLVIWNRTFSESARYEPGMGLRFMDLPEDHAQLIDDWVLSNQQGTTASPP
jgi:uncharacterized protein (TIGR02266 family)